MNAMVFTKNLEELLYYLKTKKFDLTRFLKKNYKENIHYIIKKFDSQIKQNGGQNKIDYFITEEVYELIKNSYNLRNKYIVDINDNIKYVKIGMCIENQTIGFIENAFVGILNTKRQHRFGKYKVDLYFIDHKLVVECDENNHIDRNAEYELIRENHIVSLGNKIIRFNPNEKCFDLSNVLREINKHLLKA